MKPSTNLGKRLGEFDIGKKLNTRRVLFDIRGKGWCCLFFSISVLSWVDGNLATRVPGVFVFAEMLSGDTMLCIALINPPWVNILPKTSDLWYRYRTADAEECLDSSGQR